MKKPLRYVALTLTVFLAVVINSSYFWSLYSLAFDDEGYSVPVASETISGGEPEVILSLTDETLLGAYSLYLELGNSSGNHDQDISFSCVILCKGKEIEVISRKVGLVVYDEENRVKRIPLLHFSYSMLDNFFLNKDIVIKKPSPELVGSKLILVRSY